MKKFLNYRPVPMILMMVILGVITASFGKAIIAFCFCALTLVAIACAIFVPQLKKIKGKIIYLGVFFALSNILCCVSLGFYNQGVDTTSNAEISGRISMLTKSFPDGQVNSANAKVIYIEDMTINGEKVAGRAEVGFISDRIEGAFVGDRISFNGVSVKRGLVITDSYSMRDYRNKVKYCMTASEDDGAEIKLEKGHFNVVEKVKFKVKSTLVKATNKDTAAFMYAMTFGDSADMRSEIKSNFAVTGTAHILAVSGLHVGILVGALMLVLRKCAAWTKLLICIPFMAIYCWLCNFSPSTLRSSLMVSLFLISKCLGARNDALSTISLSATIILIIKPLYLFDMGFLMSYFAVFGIILLCKPLTRIFAKIMPQKLSELLAVSISANIGLLPIMLIYFGRVSLIFIFANLILIPVISVIFPLYILILVLTATIPIFSVLLSIVSMAYSGIISIVYYFAQINFMVVDFSFEWYFVLPYMALLIFFSEYLLVERKPKKITATILAGCCLLSSVFTLRGVTLANNAVICFTDSEWREYVLIKSSKHGNYLITCQDLPFCDFALVASEMQKKNIYSLDGIIVRVLTEASSEEQKEYALALNAKRFYSGKISGNSSVPCSQSSVTASGMTIAFVTPTQVDINMDGLRVSVVFGYGETFVGRDYDILVAQNQLEIPKKGQYAVFVEENNYRLKNIMSSQFTFRIKNDRIIKIPIWSFE